MEVELKRLYADITPQYDVKLHTEGCFGKKIGWIHMVEGVDFIPLLHGDELVFNSGLNYTSEEWLVNLIESLNEAHAGGLIVALQNNHTFPEEIIEYCNRIQFPLFSASWHTPYIDIMRRFAEIILKNEQIETNLIAALKNAIYYPENEELYLNHFERNGFFQGMPYIIVIMSCHTYDTEAGNEQLELLQKSLHYVMRKGILYEENGNLIILTAGYDQSEVRQKLQKICTEDSNVCAGMGTMVRSVQDIHRSYENAHTAYRLTRTVIPKSCLCYDEIGIYKILADIKEESVYSEFVEETLGRLIRYDRAKGTDYLRILEAYFENECSIIHTSEKLYCHKNTLTYKLNKIKEVLGYDILSNENRMKIMVAFRILRFGKSV